MSERKPKLEEKFYVKYFTVTLDLNEVYIFSC